MVEIFRDDNAIYVFRDALRWFVERCALLGKLVDALKAEGELLRAQLAEVTKQRDEAIDVLTIEQIEAIRHG